MQALPESRGWWNPGRTQHGIWTAEGLTNGSSLKSGKSKYLRTQAGVNGSNVRTADQQTLMQALYMEWPEGRTRWYRRTDSVLDVVEDRVFFYI